MNACPNCKETILRAATTKCPHCRTRLGHTIPYADDWDEEERTEMSGLRMSLASIALLVLLAAIFLTWHLLPAHYLLNYLAQALTWLLAISVPVVALAALVSSILDLMRIGGTAGDAAGKGLAVAGLILSILVLTPSAFFFFSFKAPDSSKNAGARRPKEHFTAKAQSMQREKETLRPQGPRGDRNSGDMDFSVPCPRNSRPGRTAGRAQKEWDHELHEQNNSLHVIRRLRRFSQISTDDTRLIVGARRACPRPRSGGRAPARSANRPCV